MGLGSIFGGGSGSYSQASTKGKSKTDMWTSEQKKVAKQLGGWLGGYDLKEGIPGYEGQLAGTSRPETLSALFSGAQAYATGADQGNEWTGPPAEGSGLFQHYRQWSNPEEQEARVSERLDARRRLLAPQQEQEDAALRSKMASMGLGSSSDVLKKQMDIEETRRAEEDLYAMDMLDKYEALGFQASEAALGTLQQIGGMQKQIEDMGAQAEYDEWLRTQPEYNPIVEQMMAYLGLQGVSTTKSKESTSAWSVSGSMGGSGGF